MISIQREQILPLDGRTGADAALVGGKAASIERMRELGMPVPPAFVFTTEVCRDYYARDRTLPDGLVEALPAAIAELEVATGRTFGTGTRPLLVSVRSGAPRSMPGMMDTVLNLGMNDEVEQRLATLTGDPAFAADTHTRFRRQYEHVVGTAPPTDPWEQLRGAIEAVFDSWTCRRAVEYRRERGISEDLGTAVTVQAMVFGNLDDRSGTGVLFTRNPLNGGAEPYGEWLVHGQGEDVVSGRSDASPLDQLALDLPSVHAELLTKARVLEQDRQDVQDIEFTVEAGRLWLLQARAAKCSPEAAVRHAVQLADEGVIDRATALDRVTADQVQALLRQHVDFAAARDAVSVAGGKQACPGVAVGVVVTDVEEAERLADEGEDVVLARPTTDPDDVAAMSLSVAVLTELGGSTSHAAVVCREIGVPCLVGCGEGTVTALVGQTVTVDATAGVVYEGALPTAVATERDDPNLARLLEWARAADPAGAELSLPDLLRRRAATPSQHSALHTLPQGARP